MKKNLNLKLNVKVSSFSDDDIQSIESTGLEYHDYEESFMINEQRIAEVSTKRCGRSRMEDRFCAVPDFGEGQFFYAVYDGHGGSSVAKILQSELHNELRNHNLLEENIEQAIHDTFKNINEQILQMQEEKKKDGGSTALCAVNVGNQLYIVNVGDSSGILVEKGNSVIKLNSEHKPDREDEAERIHQNAGYVFMHKYNRDDSRNQARVNGELGVSRAFGDIKYVKNGVCAVPEITKNKMNNKSKYLILATDGFWDIVKITEVPNIIKQWESNEQECLLSHYLLEYASSQTTAFKKDNMTLLLIDLERHYLNLV